MSDPNAPGEPTEPLPSEPLPSEPPEDILITPMSDPDVPPGEPTMIMPVTPGALPPSEPPPPVVPTDYATPVPPPPPPPWWREHWWVVAVVALALVALIIFILWLTSDDNGDSLETNETTIPTSSLPSTSAPSTTEPATTAPATTEVATTAPATTAPPTTEATTTTTTTTEATTTTTTAAPTTTTAAPTTTSTVAPTTAAPTTTLPPPFTASGSGNRIQQVNQLGGLGVATFSHNGSSPFTVVALDKNAQPIGNPIIDRTGAYQGTVVVPAGTAAFDITADGAWQFEYNVASAARAFDGSNDQGAGDDVMFYDGDPATAHITFDGDGPFVVSSYASNGAVDQLVSEDSGPYDDSVGFPGPALIAVSGAGNWTISLS